MSNEDQIQLNIRLNASEVQFIKEEAEKRSGGHIANYIRHCVFGQAKSDAAYEKVAEVFANAVAKMTHEHRVELALVREEIISANQQKAEELSQFVALSGEQTKNQVLQEVRKMNNTLVEWLGGNFITALVRKIIETVRGARNG